ncbi:hypothetical protein [Roseixanthobacter pseudopolyaromaticivorans]|uniref:hypothetical protein n=1 Tax=Xanthobacteraceae TaxID=335928 RepID=UPI00372BB88C
MVRLFMRGRGERDGARDAGRTLAESVRRILALDEAASVSVSEIACGDPACGGAETVILVMRAGERTRAAKLLKPLASVTDEELATALVPLSAPEAKTA